MVWKHRGFPPSIRSFQTVRGQVRTFELLAVNPQLATSPMNRSNGALVTVPVVWRTLRMKNSLPSAAKTSFPLHYFRQLTQSESSSCTRLCKNDASYARRAAPSSGQISFPGGNSLREVRKFPLAVRAVKRTKRDLSQTGISPEVKRAADLRTL